LTIYVPEKPSEPQPTTLGRRNSKKKGNVGSSSQKTPEKSEKDNEDQDTMSGTEAVVDPKGAGYTETVEAKLARLNIGATVDGIDVTALKSALVASDRDDVMSTVDAKKAMKDIFEKCVPAESSKRTDAEFFKAFEAGVIYSGVYNGTSDRAPFLGYFQVAGESYHRSTIKTVLKTRVRQFYRYYADAARVILLTHEVLRRNNRIKWNFDERFDDLAFDFSDFCSGLEDDEREYIRARKLLTTAAASSFDPVKAPIQAEFNALAAEAAAARGGNITGAVIPSTTVPHSSSTNAKEF